MTERWRRRRDDVPVSHLLLDGGVLSVPPADELAFSNMLAAEVVRGVPRHVVEKRTTLFRLFFDLDAHSVHGTDLPWKEMVCMLCSETLACFDTGADTTAHRPPSQTPPKPIAVVCVAPVRDLDGGSKTKHGFHVHFPGLVVSAPIALAVRLKCLDALQREFPDALANDWGSALDAAVFGGSGLRLPWMRKGPSADPGAVYRPWIELRGDEGWVDCAEDANKSVSATRRYIGLCSMRCSDASLPTSLNPGVMNDAELELVDAMDNSGAAANARFGGRHVSLAKYSAVFQKIYEALPQQFDGQRIIAVIEGDACFFLRSTSKFCLNANRLHTSSNVYFVLRPGAISQKCYCRRDTLDGRRSGKLCRDFASEMWPVPIEVTSAFFADKFLDDVPVVDHPEVGVTATLVAMEKQVVYDDAKKRRRLMPSAVYHDAVSVSSMFQRCRVKTKKVPKKSAPKRP